MTWELNAVFILLPFFVVSLPTHSSWYDQLKFVYAFFPSAGMPLHLLCHSCAMSCAIIAPKYCSLFPSLLPCNIQCLRPCLFRFISLAGNPHVDDGFIYRLSNPDLCHAVFSGCYGLSNLGLARLARSAPNLTALDLSGCDTQVPVYLCCSGLYCVVHVTEVSRVLFWLHLEMREDSVLHSKLNNLPGITRKKEE
eukprot:1159343-Pelagomonas_calceolata.AAC.3